MEGRGTRWWSIRPSSVAGRAASARPRPQPAASAPRYPRSPRPPLVQPLALPLLARRAAQVLAPVQGRGGGVKLWSVQGCPPEHFRFPIPLARYVSPGGVWRRALNESSTRHRGKPIVSTLSDLNKCLKVSAAVWALRL